MALIDLASASDNAVLKDVIVERLRREAHIPFSELMELALYHPQHGYYFTSDPSLDYQSSPDVHPVFGAVIGRQLAEMWKLMGSPARFEVFEAGAGSGRLAADILSWAKAQASDFFAALTYTLQDLTLDPASADDRVSDLPREKVRVAAGLPDEPGIEGCILSNELLDAFPVHRVKMEGGRLYELHVALEGERLVDLAVVPAPEIIAYFETLGLQPGEGCEAEVNLLAPRWIERAARALRRGYVLTLDYGYAAADLYAPWRKRGTLLTFYRHTSGDDPYARIGRQDITASVDFTAVQRAGERAGLKTLGQTSQAEFLTNLGLGEVLAEKPAAGELEAYIALRRAVLELVDPAGLGRITALVQGKDVPQAPLRGLGGQP